MLVLQDQAIRAAMHDLHALRVRAQGVPRQPMSEGGEVQDEESDAEVIVTDPMTGEHFDVNPKTLKVSDVKNKYWQVDFANSIEYRNGPFFDSQLRALAFVAEAMSQGYESILISEITMTKRQYDKLGEWQGF